MKPQKEYEILYKVSIQQARNVFKKNFTCKMEIAPDKEEYEVAVIPRSEGSSKEWDNVQVCLEQWPAMFLTAYLRRGEKRVLSIKTKSGRVKDLWGMVEPIIQSIAKGDIGFKSYDEQAEAEPV